MTDALSRLQGAGVLSPLDVQLARTLERLKPGQSEPVLLGAAFASRASRAIAHGHICADLRELDARALVDEAGESIDDVQLPRLFEWVMQLGQTSLCNDGSDGSETTPPLHEGPGPLRRDVPQLAADHSSRKLLNRLSRVDLLVIDEMGYLNLRPEQSNIFFKLMEERYGKKSTIITTNLEYDEWYAFLGQKEMVAALLDRLRHRCYTIRISGESLRAPLIDG